MNNLIDEVLPQIQKAARSVANRWPGVVEEDDMVSLLTIHFMEAPGALSTLAGLTVEKQVARLTAIGHEKASAERSAYEVFSGNFKYSVDEVTKLLGRGALGGQVNGFDSAIEDLGRAAAELRETNDRHHELIWQRYVLNQRPSAKDKDALTRAVESLTNKMNKIRRSADMGYVNGGRFRNNRQAVNQVDLDYGGEVRYYE